MPSSSGFPSSTVSNGHSQDENENIYDLICVGFGPASLAIAVALADKSAHQRVIYLERQPHFKWHGGMLLPDARMQISFLKDLATLRDPRSRFTFLNYLKCKGRLVAFTNLSTFLPLREEYNDYLTWCASYFDKAVHYGQEITSISAVKGKLPAKIQQWAVQSRNFLTGEMQTWQGRNVVIAIGGRPKIPQALAQPIPNSRIIHSSQYSTVVPQFLADKAKTFQIAVIGSGQSAAEIFNDLQDRFKNTKAILYIGNIALRPSDDSPFVNEIFNPEKVDEFYSQPSEAQQQALESCRSTNYGVVRVELLDRLYEKMYYQRLREPDEANWHFKIKTRTVIEGYQTEEDERIRLRVKNSVMQTCEVTSERFDLAIIATGYTRNAHEELLESTRHLMEGGRCQVGRDYRIKLKHGAVADDCGIWLQGCCERTHGLSDTLLSILSERAGDLVDKMFPETQDDLCSE